VNFQNAPLSKSPSSAERGSSDYDIRHTFSAPSPMTYRGPARSLEARPGKLGDGSIIYARSAPPVNVVTGNNPFGGVVSGANGVQRPNVVPGAPFYLNQPNAPAARSSTKPPSARQPLGRAIWNATPSRFGATQWDLTLRRQFRLTERFALQTRADFFNILNHPNFGSPVNFLISPQFGQATQMLAGFLGVGARAGA